MSLQELEKVTHAKLAQSIWYIAAEQILPVQPCDSHSPGHVLI